MDAPLQYYYLQKGALTLVFALSVVLVAIGVVEAFVSVTIVANIIADMYKLAATYCKRWQKYSRIKKAYQQLGYSY